MRVLYNLRGPIDLLRLPEYTCSFLDSLKRLNARCYRFSDIGTGPKTASKEKISSVDYPALTVQS